MPTGVEFVTLPNTMEIQMVFAQAGGVAENVFHVTSSSPPTEASLASVLADFFDWYVNHLKPLQGATITLTKGMAKDMSAADSIQIEVPGTGAVTGTATGNTLPPNVTVAMKWSTGFAGRSKRGRTYHIGLTDTMVFAANMGYLTQAAYDGLIAAYAELISAINIGDQYLSVASRVHNGARRDVGVLTRILNVSSDRYVDSQRRRLFMRGA